MAFLELLPLLLLLILLISALGAFLCSRVLVRPVLEISRVSKRMADLDMTWECGVHRTDELGVLANSLNTMAKRLDTAMKELESANEQLREDVYKRQVYYPAPSSSPFPWAHGLFFQAGQLCRI